MSKPTYIYKLVHESSPPPDPLVGDLPLSELDTKSGFIHLSTASQIAGTLKHFFGSDSSVYVLRVPLEPIDKNVRWESPDASVCGDRPGEGLFPHLYNGPRLGKSEIESMQKWERTKDGWDDALGKTKDWLI